MIGSNTDKFPIRGSFSTIYLKCTLLTCTVNINYHCFTWINVGKIKRFFLLYSRDRNTLEKMPPSQITPIYVKKCIRFFSSRENTRRGKVYTPWKNAAIFKTHNSKRICTETMNVRGGENNILLHQTCRLYAEDRSIPSSRAIEADKYLMLKHIQNILFNYFKLSVHFSLEKRSSKIMPLLLHF